MDQVAFSRLGNTYSLWAEYNCFIGKHTPIYYNVAQSSMSLFFGKNLADLLGTASLYSHDTRPLKIRQSVGRDCPQRRA